MLPTKQAAVFLSVIGVDLFAFAIVKPPSDNIRAALTLFYKTLQFLAAFVAFGPPLEIFDKGVLPCPTFPALDLFYKTLQFLAAFIACGPPLEIFDEGVQTRPAALPTQNMHT